jgi:hypothetical protein
LWSEVTRFEALGGEKIRLITDTGSLRRLLPLGDYFVVYQV